MEWGGRRHFRGSPHTMKTRCRTAGTKALRHGCVVVGFRGCFALISLEVADTNGIDRKRGRK